MAKEEKKAADKKPEDAKPKKSKFKLIMIILALLLLVLGAAVGAYWYLNMKEGTFSFGGASPEASDTTVAQPSANYPNIPPQVTGQPTLLVSLPTITVNLADASANRYLKVGIDLEVASSTASKEIEANMPRIRDSIILLLSSKTQAELISAEGKIQVKNEIATRINQILGSPRVLRVFFTEFVIS